jgi:hypothetical protein
MAAGPTHASDGAQGRNRAPVRQPAPSSGKRGDVLIGAAGTPLERGVCGAGDEWWDKEQGRASRAGHTRAPVPSPHRESIFSLTQWGPQPIMMPVSRTAQSSCAHLVVPCAAELLSHSAPGYFPVVVAIVQS